MPEFAALIPPGVVTNRLKRPALAPPAVSTRIVQRTDLAPTGSGEPTQAPIAAALANAFFDATGVRIRQAPLTAPRVRAVLAAAASP